METIEELEAFLRVVTRDDARGRLSNQGIAWSIMRVDGTYNGTTRFNPTISTDLVEYGFSLLRAALELKEKKGDNALIQKAFELAARSFESLLTNSRPGEVDQGFIQIVGACCYHLAGYSAMAYSILNNHAESNSNQAESAMRLLILRNLGG